MDDRNRSRRPSSGADSSAAPGDQPKSSKFCWTLRGRQLKTMHFIIIS